jgi:TP901 family phage tail tape measure protein
MGVAKHELIQFTKTAATMAFAFELPAGELAEQMGKIAGLYKIPIPAIGSLADTINYLDDNAISKGGDIVDYLTRVGGVAGAVKITGQEMAALGSTLLTLGERTETASTATNAMFQKFAAADKGTKKFKEAMQEIGLATAEIQKGMQVDAQGTLLKVLEAIQKLPEEKRLGVMVELVGLEHSDTMAKLVGNVEEYRKQIALAGSDKAKGSMGREFAAQLATTSAQWEIAKNRITEVSVNLGAVLLPAINAVLGGLGNLTSGIADFVSGNETLVGNIAAVVGTIGGIFAASKIAAFGIGLITFAFNALKLAMMTNPIGLALTALTVAGVLLWKNWEGVKGGMVAIWETIRDTAIAAFNSIKTSVGAVIDWLAEKTAWIFATVDKVKAAANSIGDGIGGAWQGAKSFVGLGPDPAKPGTAAATAPMAAPVVATGVNVTQTNQPTYNITVQGSATDPNATAKAIRAEMERREREQAAARRAMLTDKLGY